jgi:hypothetical protein
MRVCVCVCVCVCVVRKWPLPGRSRFVCWNITRVSMWLLRNVHFVQSIRPTIATWHRWPKDTYHCSSAEYQWIPCWRVCDKNLNIVSMCAVSPVVHTSNISRSPPPPPQQPKPPPLWGSSVPEQSVNRTMDSAFVWKWPTTDAMAP